MEFTVRFNGSATIHSRLVYVAVNRLFNLLISGLLPIDFTFTTNLGITHLSGCWCQSTPSLREYGGNSQCRLIGFRNAKSRKTGLGRFAL